MADFSDKKDSPSLPQVIEQTKENLQENGLKLEEVLVDQIQQWFSISKF